MKNIKQLRTEIAEQRAPPLKGFNLAGRPEQLAQSAIKYIAREAVGMYDCTLTNEQNWQFKVTTNKNEWVRFFTDSITVQLYGQYDNPTRVAGHAEPETAALRHSLQAQQKAPYMFLDPTTMGTAFVKSVKVILNGVEVPTNGFNQHLLQYVRVSNIARKKPRLHFARQQDMVYGVVGTPMSEALQEATIPFDYSGWNATNGTRIPVYLDGIFPFNLDNQSIQTLDGLKADNLYIPPESTIDIVVTLQPSKTECMFHDGCNDLDRYYDAAPAGRPSGNLAFTFQDVRCEFEKVVLTDKAHIETMDQFIKGMPAFYPYDIVRDHYQMLDANASYTENNFKIPAMCRFLYILFQPIYAMQSMPVTNKPLSGYSRFPEHQSKMNISFAGDDGIICKYFEKFGFQDEPHHLTKKMFYNYHNERGLMSDKYDDIFTRNKTNYSVNQFIAYDCRHLMSERSETLRIRMEFSTNPSPTGQGILVFTVHPTGQGQGYWIGGSTGWNNAFPYK